MTNLRSKAIALPIGLHAWGSKGTMGREVEGVGALAHAKDSLWLCPLSSLNFGHLFPEDFGTDLNHETEC